MRITMFVAFMVCLFCAPCHALAQEAAETAIEEGAPANLETDPVEKHREPLHRYEVRFRDYHWRDWAVRHPRITVRVYTPINPQVRCPVIIFSHGLGRSRTDCAYFARYWAEAGYIVILPQHSGSDSNAVGNVGAIRARERLTQSFQSYSRLKSRITDVKVVLNFVEKYAKSGESFGNIVDGNNIAIAGHDFGAETALILAGQKTYRGESLKDPRVKAVVAMSPPVRRPSDTAAYEKVDVPSLHLTGTRDNGIVGTTRASQRRIPYDNIPSADRHLVTFRGSDHLVYTGTPYVLVRRDESHDGYYRRKMQQVTTLFFNTYLRNGTFSDGHLQQSLIENLLARSAYVESKITLPTKKESTGQLVGE